LIEYEKTVELEVLSLLALSDLKGVGFETIKSISRDQIKFSSFFNYSQNDKLLNPSLIKPSYKHIMNSLELNNAKSDGLYSARQTLEYLNNNNITVLFPDSPYYPCQLLDLKERPPWLFVQGNVDVLSRPAITAVGSRKISNDGIWLSKFLGYSLKELNAVTVSGLAEGVDQIIHRTSLRAGLPTIAVLGTGVLSDYPRGSESLRKDIISNGGAVVTEYLPTDSYSAKNFVRRNRIQAALGKTVIPVQWSIKSGTAHTVKFAFSMKRPLVFVRTPFQENFDWLPPEYRAFGSLFTLPQDQQSFTDTISKQLEFKETQRTLI